MSSQLQPWESYMLCPICVDKAKTWPDAFRQQLPPRAPVDLAKMKSALLQTLKEAVGHLKRSCETGKEFEIKVKADLWIPEERVAVWLVEPDMTALLANQQQVYAVCLKVPANKVELDMLVQRVAKIIEEGGK